MKHEQKETITNQIIEALESGYIPWVSPFESQVLPMNYLTKKEYQGMNLLLLWIATRAKGFTGNCWVGFRQANQLGGKVKKGEKGVPIVVCCPTVHSKYNEQSGEDEDVVKHYYKMDYVFNLYSQVEGIDFETEAPQYKAFDEFENLILATGAMVRHQGERAYYNVREDFINMPFLNKFKTQEGYYQTLAHELIHYTIKDFRCNRPPVKDDSTRALEELTAEIGSAFLLAEFGMGADLQNTSAYVQSWIEELKNDTNYIFKAAKLANEAVGYLMECYRGMEQAEAA
jgi:antirestriction protein ArdC